ncbi:aldolase [Choiromyces venosus 120613-1]|uniref:Transaldolase n=1 Tax=Choiromyces venosus 120613-1 TaxID=1336337 RepID=A0A3N4JQE4_9PEZI|nr:aldolase [Choiromyces venosus 120613-1]
MSCLDYLRSRSKVSCDTLDISITDIAPFEDCTSNQAISISECKKPENSDKLMALAILAKQHANTPAFPNVEASELLVHIFQVHFALKFLDFVEGRVHIQVNPNNANNEQAIFEDAKRIIKLVEVVAPGTPRERISVKIPSTYQGLRACRRLEREENIRTLATTLFTIGQAVAAAEAGCTYIAPYVNALKVHFVEGWKDQTVERGFELCALAQEVYEREGWKTTVLPASLTSPVEVLRLAGAHNITVPPNLLRELAAREHVAEQSVPSVYDGERKNPDIHDLKGLLDSEERFKQELATLNGNMEKLNQAIEIFNSIQKELQAIASLCLQA